MKDLLSLITVIFLVLSLGCSSEEYKTGEVIQLDYRKAKIEKGDWVQIDSFKFVHIGKREEAKQVKYPLPSTKVFVDSVSGKEFSRDYNPTVVPTYLAKHLDDINENLSKNERFEIVDRFSLSYAGIMKLRKSDSSNIRVSSSEGYAPRIEVQQN